jgi:alpha-glucosidase (family GH31 glycosyl hydrolase)
MVTFWPFQTPASQHWQEYSTNNYLAKKLDGTVAPWDGSDMRVYDPFNPAARNATFNNWFKGYGKYGIRYIWLDASEPGRGGG